jgi:hypothetical protein
MKFLKTSLVIAIGLQVVSAAQERRNLQKDPAPANQQIKVLSEGSHSEITKPFIAVAREPGTYSQLRKLVPALPVLLDSFFERNLVVAAFLGERNTGGYSVDITQDVDGVVQVTAKEPGKGGMVTQALTTPFKVVSLPTRPWNGLDASSVWQQALARYNVTRGDFASSEGIMGRREEYGLQGNVGVLREGKLATFVFHLRNSDGTKARLLKETISAVIEGEQATIYAMSAGSLVTMPRDNLSATVKFGNNRKSLDVRFKSVPSMIIADGYQGEGWLGAELVNSKE